MMLQKAQNKFFCAGHECTEPQLNKLSYKRVFIYNSLNMSWEASLNVVIWG